MNITKTLESCIDACHSVVDAEIPPTKSDMMYIIGRLSVTLEVIRDTLALKDKEKSD